MTAEPPEPAEPPDSPPPSADPETADPPDEDPGMPPPTWHPGRDPFVAVPRGFITEIPIGHAVEAGEISQQYLSEEFLARRSASALIERSAFDSLFAQALRRYLTDRPAVPEAAHAKTSGSDLVWLLSADISENDTEYQIELELPGVARDDVRIGLSSRLLMVRGVFRSTPADLWLMSTRRKGPFEFQARFPEDVEPAGARARLAMGVLYITVPLSRTALLQEVEVEIPTSDEE